MSDQQLIQDILTLQTTTYKIIDDIPFRVVLETKNCNLPRRCYYYYKDICKLLKIDNANESIKDIPSKYRADFLVMDLDGNMVKGTYIDGNAVIRLLLLRSPLPEDKKDEYMTRIHLH
jgi:hypothetical protein